jgi:putative hydrolase of HD superfamily
MVDNDLAGRIEFLKAAEGLKNTLRNAYTSKGRRESTAEHTWRLCLMVLLFEDMYPQVDILQLLKICIVHDLGEAISGDIAAIDQTPDSNKSLTERQGLESLIEALSPEIKAKILGYWDEYENAISKEARLAKAFDKLETLLQHTQGDNPAEFNYEFNLSYGKKYTDNDFLTARLRAIIDRDTARLSVEKKSRSIEEGRAPPLDHPSPCKGC